MGNLYFEYVKGKDVNLDLKMNIRKSYFVKFSLSNSLNYYEHERNIVRMRVTNQRLVQQR